MPPKAAAVCRFHLALVSSVGRLMQGMPPSPTHPFIQGLLGPACVNVLGGDVCFVRGLSCSLWLADWGELKSSGK